MVKVTIIATPAYGRDYETEQQVISAWAQDKDFKIENPGIRGKYINKSDANNHSGIKEVIIRYRNLNNFVTVKTGD